MSRRSERRQIDKAARAAARQAKLDAVTSPVVPVAPIVPDAAAAPTRSSRVGRGEQRASDPGLRVWRWPLLVLVPVLIVAGVLLGQHDASTDDTAVTASDAPLPMPVVADPSAPGATWYCPAGTATGVGVSDDADEGDPAPGAAEQTLIIANGSDADRRGTVTAFTDTVGAAPIAVPLDVPARSRQVVVVSDIVKAAHASALVEVDGGGVTVQHRLVGPAGRSVSLCASAPSDSWVFPVGTTRPGASLTLTLFNPFPGEAVVDITALSDDGTREPEAYQGLVVPARGVVTLELAQVITLRAEVTTVVHTRSGRIIGELVQTSDGTIVADEGEADPQFLPTVAPGMTAMLGAPGPAVAWVYPNGSSAEKSSEKVVVYNPTDDVAEVEVQVILDDPATNGVAEPFQLSIEPRSYQAVQFFGTADARVPAGVGHSVVVRSTNEVPIVSGRAIWSTVDEDPVGLAYTLGSPAVATRWSSATSAIDGQAAGSVAIFNPSPDASVTVSLRVVGSGRDDEVTDPGSFTLGPNERRVVPIPDDAWGVASSGITIQSDLPVVAENHYRLGEDGQDLSFFVLAPLVGTSSPTPATTGILSSDVLLGD